MILLPSNFTSPQMKFRTTNATSDPRLNNQSNGKIPKAKRFYAPHICILWILFSAATHADTNQRLPVLSNRLTIDIYSSTVRAEPAEVESFQTPATSDSQAMGHGHVLFESPHGFWLAPSIWSGTLYGPSMQNANWHFTQWENPGSDFPAFQGDTTATAAVRLVDFGGQWEIAQNGVNLPPGDEFSVYAEANQSHVYPLASSRRQSSMWLIRV